MPRRQTLRAPYRDRLATALHSGQTCLDWTTSSPSDTDNEGITGQTSDEWLLDIAGVHCGTPDVHVYGLSDPVCIGCVAVSIPTIGRGPGFALFLLLGGLAVWRLRANGEKRASGEKR